MRDACMAGQCPISYGKAEEWGAEARVNRRMQHKPTQEQTKVQNIGG